MAKYPNKVVKNKHGRPAYESFRGRTYQPDPTQSVIAEVREEALRRAQKKPGLIRRLFS